MHQKRPFSHGLLEYLNKNYKGLSVGDVKVIGVDNSRCGLPDVLYQWE